MKLKLLSKNSFSLQQKTPIGTCSRAFFWLMHNKLVDNIIPAPDDSELLVTKEPPCIMVRNLFTSF
jgi:hypothetical protein